MIVGWKAGGVAGASTVQSWRAIDPTLPAASTARASKTCAPGAKPEYARRARGPIARVHAALQRGARFAVHAERRVAARHRRGDRRRGRRDRVDLDDPFGRGGGHVAGGVAWRSRGRCGARRGRHRGAAPSGRFQQALTTPRDAPASVIATVAPASAVPVRSTALLVRGELSASIAGAPGAMVSTVNSALCAASPHVSGGVDRAHEEPICAVGERRRHDTATCSPRTCPSIRHSNRAPGSEENSNVGRDSFVDAARRHIQRRLRRDRVNGHRPGRSVGLVSRPRPWRSPSRCADRRGCRSGRSPTRRRRRPRSS